MNLEKLIAKQVALEKQIAEAKTVAKNLDGIKKIVADLVEANPKIALVERAKVKEKLTIAIQELVVGT